MDNISKTEETKSFSNIVSLDENGVNVIMKIAFRRVREFRFTEIKFLHNRNILFELVIDCERGCRSFLVLNFNPNFLR